MRLVTGRGIRFLNVSQRRVAPARVQTCPGERAADYSAMNEQNRSQICLWRALSSEGRTKVK